ncbi:MAG: GNAT family N-acetyltransferase [Candidatus Thiodiazotropha sp. (ex Monitilora ramsayi)]|nr:GNAT family N-acetyltransferase [Candidatus Thiodiazotropha sp. (ex Monitilora ramsayi)]
MMNDVVIEPMTEELMLWRCLHNGPLTRDSIDQWPCEGTMPWESYRKRNLPLLMKLTRIYGSCAILARDGDQIVGFLRFYPKVVYNMEGACGLCLQQDPPAGPVKDFADSDFPDFADIEDKTLVVYCLMTGSPQQNENPYQRKGIGTRMVKFLIEWAKTNGWDGIEADAFEDLPIIYEITGSAGHTFWEKLGFRLVNRHPHPDLMDPSRFVEFIETLEAQAYSAGIPPEKAKDRLVMRLDLR